MYFKVICGYECGGPEDGMMCHSYSKVIEAETAKEAERMEREFNKDDPDFIGCRVDEATEKEIQEHLELEREFKEYEEFMKGLGY